MLLHALAELLLVRRDALEQLGIRDHDQPPPPGRYARPRRCARTGGSTSSWVSLSFRTSKFANRSPFGTSQRTAYGISSGAASTARTSRAAAVRTAPSAPPAPVRTRSGTNNLNDRPARRVAQTHHALAR